MAISCSCPFCKKSYDLDPSVAGSRKLCFCGKTFTVPSRTTSDTVPDSTTSDQVYKSRNSNHYISLGLMHVLSVITTSFWIAIWVLVGSVALCLDLFARTGIGVVVSLGCFIALIMLVMKQWEDIFAAREAFRDGSDPDKTTDK